MLTTPPFRRAPWLLFKRRAALFAVIGAAAILGTVAALTPLFLSSASSAALQRELVGRCPASFGGQTINFAPLDDARAALTDAVAGDPALGDPRLYLEGTLVGARNASGEGATVTVRFVGRDGFREHIELLDGSHGPGAYIDEFAAEFMAMGAGDELVFTVPGRDPQSIRVAGVYRNIYDSSAHPYWCSIEKVTARDVKGDLPPLIVLVDTEEFADDPDLIGALFAQYARSLGDWEIPVDLDGLTVAGAQNAMATLEAADERIAEVADEVPGFFAQPNILSDLGLVTPRVDALTSALRTSILPLAGVVIVGAVGLMGGAGSYWVDRRRRELEYLAALGAGPVTIAFKAVLEFVPAVLIGGGLGWAVANLVIGAVGPSPDVDPGARVDAAWATAAVAVGGLIAVGIVVALRARRLLHERTSAGRRRLSWRIPALIAAIAGAVWIRASIGDSAVVVEQKQFVGSVDPLVLFFPLLVFVAAVLLVVEVVIRAFPLIRRVGAAGHSAYLATRRITTAPALVLALIAGAALPVATLVYASALTRSATSTIDAKGRSFIGADVSTPVFGVIQPPEAIAATSTVVVKSERVDLGEVEVDVLAVDRATFADGAYWHPTFAPQPLSGVLADLENGSDPGTLNAFVVNGNVESGILGVGSAQVDVNVLDELDAFPGMTRIRPLVVVERDAYVAAVGNEEGAVPGSRYYLWTLEQTELEVETALGADGTGYAFTIAATTTLDQLKFAAVVWTFDFLEIYAALAGLIAIGAVFLYVDTRQRARNLSYALARRMGLERGEHLLAGFLELAGLTVVGALAGIGAARLAAGALYAVLDAVPATPPGPRWIGATDLAIVSILLAVLVAGLAAILAQRTADNADTSELLRHGE